MSFGGDSILAPQLQVWAVAQCVEPLGHAAAIRDKHVPRYLAEFEYRFNRRYGLAAMLTRLGWAAVRTPPMPYHLLNLAETHA